MHTYKRTKSLRVFPMQLFWLVTCRSHMDFKHKELKEVLNISFQNRCRISGAGYCSSENIR